MPTLVLLRHGQSTWNAENLFTGWHDVDLTERGEEEARAGGCLLAEAGVDVDVVHTSLLKRAIRTANLTLEVLDRLWVPQRRHWRLNERHYGALQGLNKAETAAKYGAEQVLVWRRSYDIPPERLAEDDERHPRHDPRYAQLSTKDLPLTECLKDTVQRFLPYWQDAIAPAIKRGERVLIAAHGNSLRALVKYLDEIPDDRIVGLNIPTGIPLVYELDEDLRPLRNYYLGDPEEARRAAERVAAQTKR